MRIVTKAQVAAIIGKAARRPTLRNDEKLSGLKNSPMSPDWRLSQRVPHNPKGSNQIKADSIVGLLPQRVGGNTELN